MREIKQATLNLSNKIKKSSGLPVLFPSLYRVKDKYSITL
jgi:hypothetical protein